MLASCTIRLESPRIPMAFTAFNLKMLKQEGILRQRAYRNADIRTAPSFFDDSDMTTPYSLIVVYEVATGIALLTARYFDYIKPLMDMSAAAFDDYFLVDRMSANVASPVYRKNRERAHVLFYRELLRKNRHRNILAMARKMRGDKLLKKYLSIGLRVIGSKMHQGREHWILTGKVEDYFRNPKYNEVLDNNAHAERNSVK